jgi:hypothetical protein
MRESTSEEERSDRFWWGNAPGLGFFSLAEQPGPSPPRVSGDFLQQSPFSPTSAPLPSGAIAENIEAVGYDDFRLQDVYPPRLAAVGISIWAISRTRVGLSSM